MAAEVVLGLRAPTLQERLLHELAEATGAYARCGVAVSAVPGRSPDGLDAGVASCLLELAAGERDWRFPVVASVAPLFWVTGPPAAEIRLPEVPAGARGALLRLATARAGLRLAAAHDAPGGGPHAWHGSEALPEVASARRSPVLDVGVFATFPALGLAVAADAGDSAAAAAVAAAHRGALEALHGSPELLAATLTGRLGVPAADVAEVVVFLRARYRLVPPAEAAALAVRGLTQLGLPTAGVAAAFRAEVVV